MPPYMPELSEEEPQISVTYLLLRSRYRLAKKEYVMENYSDTKAGLAVCSGPECGGDELVVGLISWMNPDLNTSLH